MIAVQLPLGGRGRPPCTHHAARWMFRLDGSRGTLFGMELCLSKRERVAPQPAVSKKQVDQLGVKGG